MAKSDNSSDPFDLNRFVQAQEPDYRAALGELREGEKRTHWMWYIFPQIDGLGYSATARYYAIKSIGEAHAYLNHPILGQRLRECAEALLAVEGRSASDILGYPDDLKLKSSMTLFALLTGEQNSVFQRVLKRYYSDEQDEQTLKILEGMKSRGQT